MANNGLLTGVIKTSSLWKLLGLLLAAFSLVAGRFIVNIEWPAGFVLLDKVVYFNRFASDFLLASAIIVIFYSRYFSLRLISYLLIFGVGLIYFTQAQSIDITGAFLPAIALENAEHVDFLQTDKIIYVGIIWLFILVTFFFMEQKLIKSYAPFLYRLCFMVILLLAAGLVKNDKRYLSPETIDERSAFFTAGKPGVPHASPLSEMSYTLIEYGHYLRKQNWITKASKDQSMPSEAADFVYKHFKQWSDISEEHPLVKEDIYTSSLPFEAVEGTEDQKLNLIVFFAEGMSARLIEPYTKHFPGISPNFKDLAEHGMRVDNFYNHTYATYRGLGGSICSIHPVGRLLKETEYYCMPHILKEDGYESHFLFSQREAKTGLDEMFIKAGFDHVDTVDTLAPALNLPKKTNRLTDRELIDGLILRLDTIQKAENPKPFFIGLYNFETHTGIRLNHGEPPYKRPGHEQSYLLDTFHNFDRVFGVFWEYFKNSELYKNTIVVVTTDHATYPSKDYKSLTHYNIWADRIPLLIYHPTLKLDKKYNAGHVSSINLAPTLLHLMGTENRPNSFLGTSIFDQRKKPARVMVGAGRGYWYLDDRGRWTRIDQETRPSKRISKGIAQFKFIYYFHSLERGNKIWKNDEVQPPIQALNK